MIKIFANIFSMTAGVFHPLFFYKVLIFYVVVSRTTTFFSFQPKLHNTCLDVWADDSFWDITVRHDKNNIYWQSNELLMTSAHFLQSTYDTFFVSFCFRAKHVSIRLFVVEFHLQCHVTSDINKPGKFGHSFFTTLWTVTVYELRKIFAVSLFQLLV